MNFDNRSSSGEWQWLSKGLADMIITDLTASERLMIVERERLNEIFAELQLTKAIVVDSSIADQVGRIAKVDWVLFGSFLKEGDHLKIEAHILDLKTQELLRVEWVEGLAEEVLHLEKRLVQQLLERLDIPITPKEKRSIMYVPTDSVPAFEHYSKSLDLYDNGLWFDALLECRLAVRQDTNFIKARGRVAELYYEIGKPEHALVEYQDLVKADKNNTSPEHIYYKMGRLLEDKFRNHKAGVVLYEKIVKRHPELQLVFDDKGVPLNEPPVIKIGVGNPLYCLRVLERIAVYQEYVANKVEAAKIYWQIYTIMRKGNLQRGVLGDLQERCRERFDSLYQQLILENCNYIFAPSYPYFYNHNLLKTLLVPENGGIFQEEVLEQYYQNRGGKHQKEVKFLAPKDKEIAEIAVTVNTDTAVAVPATLACVQINCQPLIRKRISYKKFKLKTGKQTASFKTDPGNRTVEIIVFGENSYPEIEVKLRDWVGLKGPIPQGAEEGRYEIRYSSPPAKVYFDGKLKFQSRPPRSGFDGYISHGKHVVEIYWQGESHKLKEFHVQSGKTTQIFLHNGREILSQSKVAEKGSNTYLYTDRKGKIWLLWDQAGLHSWKSHQPDEKSDLYYSASTDGTSWSQPQKLSVSSSEMDMKPILQQDSKGIYWLVWCSHRDPDESGWLWISSSLDGAKWSFPRKIDLPADIQMAPMWKEAMYLPHFFSIDMEENFWLIWQCSLLKSVDMKTWTQVDIFSRSYDKEKPFRTAGFLCHDSANRLLALSSNYKRIPRNDGTGRTRGISTQTLWLQREEGMWKNLGDLADDHLLDVSLTTNHGLYVVAYSTHKGIFLKSFDSNIGWSQEFQIESYISEPAFPSVTVLHDGQIVVSYSCKEGIITKLVNLDNQ
jgi:TolB-like protein